MPLSYNESDINNLIAARSALISACLQAELQQLTDGQIQVDYSLDGESYSFAISYEKAQERIKRYTELINIVSGPWEVRGREG